MKNIKENLQVMKEGEVDIGDRKTVQEKDRMPDGFFPQMDGQKTISMALLRENWPLWKWRNHKK